MAEQARDDGKVVSLLPNDAMALDPAAMVERLRSIADRMEAGDYGQIERVGVILESPDSIDSRFYGRRVTRMEAVGLLEYAKFHIMNEDNEL